MTRVRRFRNKNGYWYESNGVSLKAVHRLVAERCVPNPNPSVLTDVNHIDGDKNNNDPSNLEWATRSQNIKHAYSTGLRKGAHTGVYGANHPRSQAVCGYNEETTVYFESLNSAEKHGFSASKISNCLHGKRHKHRGLKWRRVDDNQANKEV